MIIQGYFVVSYQWGIIRRVVYDSYGVVFDFFFDGGLVYRIIVNIVVVVVIYWLDVFVCDWGRVFGFRVFYWFDFLFRLRFFDR